MLARQDRSRLAAQRRQLVHEIVERLQLAAPGVEQHFVQPVLFRFAGEERNAHRLRGLQFLRHLRQHGDAARDVKAADANLIARGAKLARQVYRARILVRLRPHDADQGAPALLLQAPDNAARNDTAIGFVVGLDIDPDAGAEHLALPRILRQAEHTGERVRRHNRAEPLDRIAVVVVVGRLDKDEGK